MMKFAIIEYLFSYGTLQLESVQFDTFGRKLQGSADELPGYKLSYVEIKDDAVIASSRTAVHPIITSTGNPHDVVEGIVFSITAEELRRADEYEVDSYKRVGVVLKSGLRAWVYVDAECPPN